ncbi:peroxiredoxin-like family protein [Seonamhaeicola marinus]|uniref:thioredoxin-dependent peroxiredoxin n=1 Tax=Seonamhaeicola marinus TaxID=1912246 RepID=A0A5D0HS11_9FLAO|nr:peroxiredoxin-like family protein [Seonamhaeicola marinus]TYA74035.1 AhpC/TSA family protein [Seonamhaeicola marinus]
MILQDSLDKLREKIEGRLPKSQVDIMHQATRELETSGIGMSVLKVGSKAPEFGLNNQEGTPILSTDLLNEAPLVVTFYRGIWCPYCNTDLAYLKRYKSNVEGLGGNMLSISPQVPKFNKKILEQQRLNFDLLSDRQNEVAAKFGLRWEMVNPLKSLYKDDFKISLPMYNGDDSWTLPIPARFIIDTDGIIKYAEYSIDYTKRPNPEVLIQALKKL